MKLRHKITDLIEKYGIKPTQEQEFFDDVFEYGTARKINGAKSLAKLGKQMRDQQNRYFSTRSDEALRESKKAEEQFDRAVEVCLK